MVDGEALAIKRVLKESAMDVDVVIVEGILHHAELVAVVVAEYDMARIASMVMVASTLGQARGSRQAPQAPYHQASGSQ